MQFTPTDMRNLALLSVATMAAGFLVLALPYVGFPLAGFALGWVTYRFGPATAAALALTVSAVVAVFGPSLLGTGVLDGLFVAVALLAIGPVAAEMLRRYPALNVALGVALVTTVAFLVAPIGDQTLAISRELLGSFMTSTATSRTVDPVALKTASDTLIRTFAETWPANAFYTMAFSAAVSIPFVARAGRSLAQPVRSYGALADLDLSFHVVWPMILGLGLTALGTLWAQAPVLVSSVGQNTLMVIRPLLFLQGAAVFAALYRRMNAGRLTRIIGLALLCLTELFIPSVSLVGAVDLFANLRKVPRAGGTPTVTAL